MSETATVVAETAIPIANDAVMVTAIKTELQSATEIDRGSVIVIAIAIASALAVTDPRLPSAATIPQPVV